MSGWPPFLTGEEYGTGEYRPIIRYCRFGYPLYDIPKPPSYMSYPYFVNSDYEPRYSPSPSPSPPPTPMEKPVVKPLPGRPRKKEPKSKRANKLKVDKGKKKVVIDSTAGDSDEVAHPRSESVDSFATSSQYQDPEPPKKRRRVEKNPNVAPSVNSQIGERVML